MNERSSMSTALAVPDKRTTQRPGGCVGIFFQLLDWNRRLAKKKLFSKKLLPPVRSKWVSKKFGGDEKRPKLLLIADENRGGFPNPKKVQTCAADSANGFRSPGLVARLMGLESMPVVRREKSRKPVSESPCGNEKKEEPLEGEGDMCIEKVRHQRPQKLQKTGLFERQAVAKLSTDALQFRDMLMRSKRQQQQQKHNRLASPVKSPRVFSGRSAARLMEAATRILEPGLQATNRAKSALPYVASHPPPQSFDPLDTIESEKVTSIDGGECVSFEQMNQETSSCRSCGSLLNVSDLGSDVEDMVLENSSSTSGMSNGSPSSKLMERDVENTKSAVLRNQHRPESVAVQSKVSMQSKSNDVGIARESHDMRLRNEQQNPSRLRGQCSPLVPEGITLGATVRQTNVRRNQTHLMKDGTSPASKLCHGKHRRDSSSESSKDFVTLKRNAIDFHGSRLSSRAPDDCRNDSGRSTLDRTDDSSTKAKVMTRKRRPVYGPQLETSRPSNTSSTRQKSCRRDTSNGKGAGPSVHTMSQNHVKNGESRKRVENTTASGKKEEAFMFTSPMRRGTVERRRGQSEAVNGLKNKPLLDAKSKTLSAPKASAHGQDTIGALLERKIRELSCSESGGLATGDALAVRSTAAILQELISALTAERPEAEEDNSHDNGYECQTGFSMNDNPCYESLDMSYPQMLNVSRKSQEGTKMDTFVELPHAKEPDQPSPVSILEASFSNESSLSGSLNSSSGLDLQLGFTERLCHISQPYELDADLLDSAISTKISRFGLENVNVVLGDAPKTEISAASEVEPEGNELSYVGKVVANAELLFDNISQCDPDRREYFLIDPSLLDALEALVDSSWIYPSSDLHLTEAKNGDKLRRFLFDCMIDYLDMKYSHCCNSGYKAWARLPLFFNREDLPGRVFEEIRKWREMSSRFLDEILEWEMSHSTGKWTGFETEAFEAGSEIERDILHTLVDEMVVDLWQQ
ncbi:hypothetical protein QJS04_geneDACA018529 [Acorus gramineus]|uniref:DUF4378 domain-containing protein n=1 Tax=Acorus gramineus TaxID=55184 RepID=A0AAV9B0B9_ACOGR|nr:hypothetical protein QJS04_geneDACA018529 [Acorus gramineus]